MIGVGCVGLYIQTCVGMTCFFCFNEWCVYHPDTFLLLRLIRSGMVGAIMFDKFLFSRVYAQATSYKLRSPLSTIHPLYITPIPTHIHIYIHISIHHPSPPAHLHSHPHPPPHISTHHFILPLTHSPPTPSHHTYPLQIAETPHCKTHSV